MQPTTLVVYYSRTGTTATVGNAIALDTGADVEVLQDGVNRDGTWGFMRSIYDAIRKDAATLQPLPLNPARYDLVVIGTPDWGKSISSPVRKFLQDHQGRLHSVAFFLTDGETDHAEVFEEMARLAGQNPVATLGIPHSEVVAGRYQPQVAAFVDRLQARPKPAAPRVQPSM